MYVNPGLGGPSGLTGVTGLTGVSSQPYAMSLAAARPP